MDALVRLVLTGKPLPEALLAPEWPGLGTSAALAGLSPKLASRSVFDYAAKCSGNSATSQMTEQKLKDEVSQEPSETLSPRLAEINS